MAHKKIKVKLSWKYILLVLVGLVIGVAIGSLLYKFNNNKLLKKIEDSKPIYTSISDRNEVKKVVEDIENCLSDISKKNTAFTVQVGNSVFECYLYNKYGECIMQSSDGYYTTIFTKDNNSVKNNVSDNTVLLNSSVDLLSPCSKVISMLKDGVNGVELVEVTYKNNNAPNIKEYVINIKGYDTLKMVYSDFGEDFAEAMIDSLKQYVGDGWVPELQFGYIYATSNEVGLYCNAVIDGEAHLNWVCEGYVEFLDWQLDNKWYTTEFKTENSQVLYDLMQSELKTLNKLMEQSELNK